MSENKVSNEPEVVEGIRDRVKFDYIKSNFFRVVHADGVLGGLTPRLDIHMDVWSERQAIPRELVHELKPDGTLGDELKEERTARDAIVREVEVGIVIDVALAKAMIDWLQEKINRIEETRAREVGDQEGEQ